MSKKVLIDKEGLIMYHDGIMKEYIKPLQDIVGTSNDGYDVREEVSNVNDRLNAVDSQLEHKVNKDELIYIKIDDFGGVPNDANFDNTPILLNAINYLIENKNRGVIRFSSGVYTFTTPVIITQVFDGITLEGVCSHSGNNLHTVLRYTGSDYFLTLENGGLYYNINNLAISCSGANGIKLKSGTQKNVWGKFKNIRISDCLEGINIQQACYFYLDTVSVSPNNENFNFGIKISGYNGTTELIYLDKVIVEGNYKSNENSVGIVLEDLFTAFVSNCDICNISNSIGLLIQGNSATTYNINVHDCNFIRNLNHIKINALNSNINAINLSNNHHIFGGNNANEIGINLQGNQTTDKVVQYINIVNPLFRSINSFLGYEIYSPDSKANEIKICNKTSINTGGKWKHEGGAWTRDIVEGEANGFRFDLTGDGQTTVFKVVVSSKSYHMNPPAIITNCELPIPYGVKYSNTYGGEYSITFTFKEAPRSGGFYIYGIRTNTGYQS